MFKRVGVCDGVVQWMGTLAGMSGTQVGVELFDSFDEKTVCARHTVYVDFAHHAVGCRAAFGAHVTALMGTQLCDISRARHTVVCL